MDSLLSNVRSGGKEERNRTAGGPYVRALRMKKDYDWEDVMNGKFLLGAATAAHQVEGNNIYSDFWALEQMENSSYKEPSLDADLERLQNRFCLYQRKETDFPHEMGLLP